MTDTNKVDVEPPMHRLEKKVDAAWIPISEWMTGEPDASWIDLVASSPTEWRIAEPLDGKKVADAFRAALTKVDVDPIPDCGEAGHADGCCGNAQCLPSARRKLVPASALAAQKAYIRQLEDANTPELVALRTQLAEAQAEVERLKVLARDAFTEGYFSCTTYNDVETSDCDTQWEKSDVAAKVKGNV